MFLGLSGTRITYDDKDKQWKMSIPHRPNITANCSASIGSLALGVHQWTISNDLNCQEGTIETKLTFSTCHLGGERKRVNNNSEIITWYEEPEFTCKNGLCIDITYRCDGIIDCMVRDLAINLVGYKDYDVNFSYLINY